jgi:hypothetical protein
MVTRSLCLLFLLALSASAQTPRMPPPESVNRNEMVGRWLVPGYQTGNGLTPTQVMDASGRGFHGTTSGNPTYRNIYSRPALDVNGSAKYVTVPNNSDLNVNVFSASIWVNIAAAGSKKNVFAKTRSSGGTTPSYGLESLATSSFNAFVLQSYTPFVYKDAQSIPVVNNSWNHVVMVWDGASLRLYLNSKLQSGGSGSGSGNPTYVGASALMIGSRTGGDTLDGINGSTADFRLYSRVLTPTEIALIYRGLQ